eukprot:8032132-Pyramimonas_sp.AAC.1
MCGIVRDRDSRRTPARPQSDAARASAYSSGAECLPTTLYEANEDSRFLSERETSATARSGSLQPTGIRVRPFYRDDISLCLTVGYASVICRKTSRQTIMNPIIVNTMTSSRGASG